MDRLTRIVCTLGPATSDVASIQSLIDAGMDIARLNFSHASYEEHKGRMDIVKKLSTKKKKIKILQDLPGPKIRLAALKNNITLKEGDKVKLTDAKLAGKGEIPVNFDEFSKSVTPTSTILLCDGTIKLKTDDIRDNIVFCTVEIGGILSSNKGINIVGTTSDLGAITPQDIEHIKFGLENEVDFIAASFIRSRNDVKFLKSVIAKDEHDTPIISKIEKPEAMKDLNGIIEESDGIMVGRGDLGVEMGLENVPLAQKRIIAQCNHYKKPVITATQMLFSMINNRTPTRAEASDIANAILDGTDALMLSEESAVGKYPSDAVAFLDKVAVRMEKEENIRQRLVNRDGKFYDRFLH